MRKIGFLDKNKWIIGMIHLPPLPGTPFYKNNFDEIIKRSVESAVALFEGGANGCLIQTVDRVYGVNDDAEIARIIAVSKIAEAIADATDESFEIGVQIMRNAAKASLAVAKLCRGTFIKVEALVGMSLSPHGLVEANPLEVMEYRKKIDAFDINVVADVHTIHYRWFNNEKTVEEVAKYAKLVGADAVSLGDKSEEKMLSLIESVRNQDMELPIILSGHTNHANVRRLLKNANGAFVGSCFEIGGWGGMIDKELVKKYMDTVRMLN